jgi:hypothetical protein
MFGWLLRVYSLIGGQFTLPCLLLFFCFSPFNVQNDGTASPHMLQIPPASSLFLPLPLALHVGWWLCLPFKFRPLKANAPFSLYLLTCVVSRPTNKPTNCGTTAKPEEGCLAWDHRERWRHVLGAPLTSSPWRERAKPLGVGRWWLMLAVVCFCVFVFLCFCVFVFLCFCVVVVCGLFAIKDIYIEESLLDQPKRPIFAHS